jgi:hypothetical protein
LRKVAGVALSRVSSKTRPRDGSTDCRLAACEPRGYLGELFQRGFQIIGDLGGENVGGWQRVSIGEALVLDPEQIEAQLVPLQQLLVFVAAPAALGIFGAPSGCDLRSNRKGH